MIIGISGVARCGKDSFYKFAKEYLDSKNEWVERHAFADALKRELEEFVFRMYGLDVWSDKTEDKEVFRELMVSHGSIQRKRTDGRYWIEKVLGRFNGYEQGFYFITDVRYPNELKAIHELGGKVIHVTRWRTDNFVLWKDEYPPANPEEAKNDPLVKEKADFRFSWYDFNGREEEAKKEVIELIKKVNIKND